MIKKNLLNKSLGGIKRKIIKTMRWFYHKNKYYLLELNIKNQANLNLNFSTFELLFVQQEHKNLYLVSFNAKMFTEKLISAIMNVNNDFYIYKNNEIIKYYCCVSKSGTLIESVNWKKNLNNHEAYIHSCFTFPDYRKQRIHSQAISWIVNNYTLKGVSIFYSIVLINNYSSLKGFYSNGFKPMKLFTVYHFLGKKRKYICKDIVC